MTSIFKLLILTSICISFQSCGGEEENTLIDNSTDKNTIDEVIPDDEKEIVSEKVDKIPEVNEDYHITLNKDGQELSSGLGKGEVRISDVFLCSVNDWKLKILTDEYDPHKMVGNEYNAHIISDEFNSFRCKCHINEVTKTGVTNSTGEKIKAQGDIKCDDNTVTGTFAVKLIQQEK